MKTLLQPAWRYVAELYRASVTGWDRFWFTPADPTTLAMIRIATGLILLYVYVSCGPAISSLIGAEAWIDDQAMGQIRAGVSNPAAGEDGASHSWWGHSLWFYVRNPAAINWVYAGFLAAILCMLVGLRSRTACVLVWIGHLSFIHRSHTTWFGLDVILAMLLLYLMFGPTGDTLSVDRLLRDRRKRRAGESVTPPVPSWSANVVIRMIQIHLCIIYLCAGLAKLQGEMWWDGTAIWHVLMIGDLAPVDVRWMAQLPYWCVDLVSTVGVAATLAFEISFVFLIWNRMLRPLLLLAAVALHVGIGVFMGLDAFAAAMLTACLSFVAPESLRWFLDSIRGKSSETLSPGIRVPQSTD